MILIYCISWHSNEKLECLFLADPAKQNTLWNQGILSHVAKSLQVFFHAHQNISNSYIDLSWLFFYLDMEQIHERKNKSKEREESREQERRDKVREETEARGGGKHGKEKKFHTVCLLFFPPRENTMTQSDGRATALASLNWETGNNKNPMGVVCVCRFFAHSCICGQKKGAVSKKRR